MAQTLDEFLNEERERLAKFEAYWRASHAVAPNAYPMAMDDGNEGLWFEAWINFNADSDRPPKPGEYEPVPDGYVPPDDHAPDDHAPAARVNARRRRP